MRYYLAFALAFVFIGCQESTPTKTDYMWHLYQQGDALHTAFDIDRHAHINIKEAWQYTKGEGVSIAILDGGFDTANASIRGNIHNAYDVVDEDDNVSIAVHESRHGTNCAALACGSETSNIIGVAPKAKLILIRMDATRQNSAIDAFAKAIELKPDVISCSWGSYGVYTLLPDLIKQAYDAGIVVVFATGNEGYALDEEVVGIDESELEWVIGVGASSEANDVTVYSDYGSNIDIIAPGGDTSVLGIRGYLRKGEASKIPAAFASDFDENSTFVDGTSFATPQVAGTVALIKSVNPDLNVTQIRQILIDTTQKVGHSAVVYDENGFNLKRAYGKLDAGAAVKLAHSMKQH